MQVGPERRNGTVRRGPLGGPEQGPRARRGARLRQGASAAGFALRRRGPRGVCAASRPAVRLKSFRALAVGPIGPASARQRPPFPAPKTLRYVNRSWPAGAATGASVGLVPLTVFSGGDAGQWRVTRIEGVTGPELAAVPRLKVGAAEPGGSAGRAWSLRGLSSDARYTRRAEQDELADRQPALGRPDATCAALIPITKSAAWWALAPDERRGVLQERSHHITIGLEYLPAVARRLHHGRDLGEPFDFLTWFEYAPRDEAAFERLVARLRATPEWTYVQREVDIRLVR